MKDVWNWRRVRLFANLSQGKIDEIVHSMPEKRFHKGDYIYRAGDPADELFILRSGTIKLFYINSAGREQILDIVQAGDAFGDLFLGSTGIRLLSAQALDSITVHRLHSDVIVRLIRHSPDLADHFLHYLAYAERQRVSRIQVLLQPAPQDRLLGVLFSLVGGKARCADNQVWMMLPESITQESIANMAALNRSTVSMLINRLRREGMLGGRGRTLSINTARALQTLQALGLEVGGCCLNNRHQRHS